jgi:hypothetical protein
MRWNKSRRGRVDLAIEERRRRAAAYLKSGATVRQVAAALGCGAATACRDRQAVLRQYRQEQCDLAQDYITLELARLDACQVIIWPRVVSGRLDAIDTFLRISKARRELLGLDRPRRGQLEVSGPRGWTLPLPPSFETMVQRVYGTSGAFGPEPNGGRDDTTLPLDVRRP